MDTPIIPSQEEFQKFFLYIGYDTISDRSNVQNTGEKTQHQQYRKFVQSNKDSPWAKDLLSAVASVNKSRNQYKVYIPMLMDRNMGALYRVCNDIVASNTPPHREVSYMERCYITGVWQEKNIDISKGGRGNSNNSGSSGSNSNGTSPLPRSPSISPATTPLFTPAASGGAGCSPLGGVDRVSSSSPLPNPPPSSSSGNGVFISPRFKHFAQMLWTLSKIDLIIKNYASDWYNGLGPFAISQSRQMITTQFGQDSQVFCGKLYRIFIHAIGHVCRSLHDHIHVPMFVNGGGAQKRNRYTILPSSSLEDDVEMEDIHLNASKLV